MYNVYKFIKLNMTIFFKTERHFLIERFRKILFFSSISPISFTIEFCDFLIGINGKCSISSTVILIILKTIYDYNDYNENTKNIKFIGKNKAEIFYAKLNVILFKIEVF